MRADRIHQIGDNLASSRILVVSFDHPIDRGRYLLTKFGDAVNECSRQKTHRTGDRAPMTTGTGSDPGVHRRCPSRWRGDPVRQ